MQYSDLIFTRQDYNGDYQYFFNIDATHWGNAYDKINGPFHVWDSVAQKTTSYETRSDFENFLQNKNNIAPVSNNGLQFTGLPKYNIGGINATPIIIIGAVLLITFLFLQK